MKGIMKDHEIQLQVNRETVHILVSPNLTLMDMLRDQLGLTGTKNGCDMGDCGSCTVLANGKPQLSCMALAAEFDGGDIVTIEGLAHEGLLTPMQDAIHRHVAAQCGFCTPGIVIKLRALLAENSNPNDAAIQEALGSNICRCTGYTKILSAVQEVIRGGAERKSVVGDDP